VRLEQRVPAGRHPFLGELDQRPHVAVQLVLGTVVGVQRDVDRVLVRHDVRELGQGDGSGDHVLDGGPGEELGSTGRDLDDPVAAGLRKAAEGGVQRL
jgi:hypothetical protein